MDPIFNDFFGEFFSQRQGPSTARRTSLGSGVLVDASGTIVTNEHVIVRATEIRVLMADKTRVRGQARSAPTPTPISRCSRSRPRPRCPTSSLPTESDVLIGETVIAIGNPFGSRTR